MVANNTPIPDPAPEPLVSVHQASRAIRKGRRFVRLLIDAGRVQAYQIGGTAKRPLLAVRVSELRKAALDAMRYVPPTVAAQQALLTRGCTHHPGKLHPAAQRMLERGASRVG
jgi:hypothetical protein